MNTFYLSGSILGDGDRKMTTKHPCAWEVFSVGNTDVKTNNGSDGKRLDIIEVVGREGAQGRKQSLMSKVSWTENQNMDIEAETHG